MLKRGRLVGNKYLVRHLIAEGGMAEIYLAQTKIASKKCRFAIKRLKAEYHANSEIVQRFVLEGKLLLELKHPLLLNGIEFLFDEGEYLIVMEYVSGIELRHLQRILSQAASHQRLKAVLAIGILVCRALSYLSQSKGFVHGDLSPENIMIGFDGGLKIIDFGLSSVSSMQQKTENQLIIANRRYMAPEQIAGGVLSEGGDVYSLCLVLSELMGGDEKVTALGPILEKGMNSDATKRQKNMPELLYELYLIAENYRPFVPSCELRTLMGNNNI